MSTGSHDLREGPPRRARKGSRKSEQHSQESPMGEEVTGLAADNRFDPAEYELRKRLSPRMPVRPNDVYVTVRTNFQAQMKRCQRLLNEQGYAEVWIHGLGPAINRAINLALQLRRQMVGSVEVDVKTDTVAVTDELTPLLDDGDFRTRQRNCSAVHIRFFRPAVPVDIY